MYSQGQMKKREVITHMARLFLVPLIDPMKKHERIDMFKDLKCFAGPNQQNLIQQLIDSYI
jgi:hypothetical protein